MITLTVTINEREPGRLFFFLDPNRTNPSRMEIDFQTLVTKGFQVCAEEFGRAPNREVVIAHWSKRKAVKA